MSTTQDTKRTFLTIIIPEGPDTAFTVATAAHTTSETPEGALDSYYAIQDELSKVGYHFLPALEDRKKITPEMSDEQVQAALASMSVEDIKAALARSYPPKTTALWTVEAPAECESREKAVQLVRNKFTADIEPRNGRQGLQSNLTFYEYSISSYHPHDSKSYGIDMSD